MAAQIIFHEGGEPADGTVAAGTIVLYNDSGVVKQKDSSNVITDLTNSGGGGGATYLKDYDVDLTTSNNFNSSAPTNIPGISFTVTDAGDYVFKSKVNCNADGNAEVEIYIGKSGTFDPDSRVNIRQQKNQNESITVIHPLDGLIAADVITVMMNTNSDNIDLTERDLLSQSWNT